MKADVVICFYRSHILWPAVARGLQLNQDYIGKVIISNDEEWAETCKEALTIPARKVGLTVPLEFVGHTRNGMQQAKCINDGVKVAISDFVLQIDDDIILAKDCVKTFLLLAETKVLLTGRLHDIARKPPIIEIFDNPPILKEDTRIIDSTQGWPLLFHVRDSFLFYAVKDYWEVEGHDESIHDGTEKGYGFIDYVFAMRWFSKFGLDSYEMTQAKAYHMSGLKPGSPFSLTNKARFEEKLAKFKESLNAT